MRAEPAVSPVVGVMALLALGIILAAILSAFAGGLADKSIAPPSAEITAYSSGLGDEYGIVFEHRGGDQLSPRDCKVTVFVGRKEASFSVEDMSSDLWRSGKSVKTGNLSRTAELFGMTVPELQDVVNKSVPAELRIYHLPTNVLLFQSKILLEEHI